MTRRFLIWFWSGGGGGSQFAVDWAHRLARRFGFDNVTLSLRADDPTVDHARAHGLDVLAAHIVSDRRRPISSLAALGESQAMIEDHIRRSGAEIVGVAMNFATAAPLSLSLRTPLVYCAHDPEPHSGDFAALAQRVTQSVLLNRANIVVALSDYAAGRLRRLRGVAPKLHTAPLSSVFAPRTRSAPAGGPVRLLFVGRMLRYKGLDLLAETVAALALRHDWRLTVAGEGPALDDAMMARLSTSHTLIRRGRLSADEIEALFASHDVLLAPYEDATQSGVVSQALAWGVPIIATPVGALEEQIRAGGWLAPRPDFAAAVARVLDAPEERRARAAEASLVAREAWSADHWGWMERLT